MPTVTLRGLKNSSEELIGWDRETNASNDIVAFAICPRSEPYHVTLLDAASGSDDDFKAIPRELSSKRSVTVDNSSFSLTSAHLI